MREELISMTVTSWVRDGHVAIGAVHMTANMNIWCQCSHQLLQTVRSFEAVIRLR